MAHSKANINYPWEARSLPIQDEYELNIQNKDDPVHNPYKMDPLHKLLCDCAPRTPWTHPYWGKGLFAQGLELHPAWFVTQVIFHTADKQDLPWTEIDKQTHGQAFRACTEYCWLLQEPQRIDEALNYTVSYEDILWFSLQVAPKVGATSKCRLPLLFPHLRQHHPWQEDMLKKRVYLDFEAQKEWDDQQYQKLLAAEAAKYDKN